MPAMALEHPELDDMLAHHLIADYHTIVFNNVFEFVIVIIFDETAFLYSEDDNTLHVYDEPKDRNCMC